jgi:hypothetical protein
MKAWTGVRGVWRRSGRSFGEAASSVGAARASERQERQCVGASERHERRFEGRSGDAEQVWLRGAAAAQQRKGDARWRSARGGRDRGARKMGGEQVPCASKESLGKESSSGGQGEEGVGESGRE